ncbi:hypothetical protein BDV35DRAFT_79275 [Aspergillus flavus]|uniref:Uncharacterized protein n=2 Tax=Aspergillus subgen. Circumdati TaxID=2720871 RepID=A0A5N6H9S0_ASPFL|nr:hypothetical protein Ao3042_04751 [Aspergillus oryzae 3.042]KAB8250399.1 hypothetical protein BDV35DRAFT_79275 [Aspergillus flavus]KDE80006.1 hypothetical protein AO1008_06440 [Aspergillus oryzae 100-8]|eukprot:EIT78809.1 hypothetical protein Ao3042_04751 [Aspergillus oryzae 3.042]
MRLRDSVRPPERYESEHFYTSLGQKSLRQNRNTNRPPYIDFNPNLPPAVFPTLDLHRPEVPESDKGAQRRGGEEADNATTPQHGREQAGNHGETKDNNVTRVDLEDISISQVENYVSSNGDLNQVYIQNMATMAAVDSSSVSDGLHDETDGIDVHDESAHEISDPKWSDLCPGIQVEVFDNLLQFYTWKDACHKLNLSREDQEEVEEHISARDKQMEREESQMKNMRRKQLRALLKIDNSARHLQDSHQFVFRKISRGTTGHLRRGTSPDYLMCHAKEVMKAKEYLRQQGLDPRYAGDWGNSISPTHPSGNDQDQDMSNLGKQVNCAQYLELATDTADDYMRDFALDYKAPASILDKQSFINTIGAAASASPRDMALCRGNLDAAPRWLNLLYQHSIRNYQPAFRENKLVCLKIGTERAAQIHDTQQIACIQPAKLVKRFPPIDAIYYDPPSWTPGVTQSNGAGTNSTMPPRPRQTLSGEPQPLQRTMGGNWSYSSFEPHPTTSSMRFQQKLEEARLETQRARIRGTQQPPGSGDYEPSFTPRQSPEGISRSPSTATGRCMSPNSSGELYGASMPSQSEGSSRTVAFIETSLHDSTERGTAPGTMYSPSIASNSYHSGNLWTQPSVAHTIQVDEEHEGLRYEDEYCPTDDEVVLLPGGNPY